MNRLCAGVAFVVGVAVAAGELGAGQKVKVVLLSQACGLLPSGGSVVIGQRESGQPGVGDERHQLFKALGAV